MYWMEKLANTLHGCHGNPSGVCFGYLYIWVGIHVVAFALAWAFIVWSRKH